LDGAVTTVTYPGSDKMKVVFATFAGKAIAENDLLFKISVKVLAGADGSVIPIGYSSNIADSLIKDGGPPSTQRLPEFRGGEINIVASGTCDPDPCNSHGSCSNGLCTCYKGYNQATKCGECAEGYTDYPTCTLDTMGSLGGVILTLHDSALQELSSDEYKKAFSSAYVIVTSPAANGQTINIEGVSFDLSSALNDPLTSLPFPDNNLGKIQSLAFSIIDGLNTWVILNPTLKLGVNASLVPGMPGVVKLTATAENDDGTLKNKGGVPAILAKNLSSTSGDVLIVPVAKNTLTVSPTLSYKTRVIGVYIFDQPEPVRHETVISDIAYSRVTWKPQPTNILSSADLNGGWLKRGDVAGAGTLYVEVERAGASPVISNEITVEVPSGPVIEYARIVGSGSLERGGRINLSVKVSDVDSISDIQDIRSVVVRSAETTYAEIEANAEQGDIFAISPFDFTKISAINASVQSGQETATVAEGTDPATSSTPAVQNYRIYSIPVEIPQSQNLVDGNYKLVLEISDVAGHVATQVIQIYVGNVTTGDVNGDGNVDQLDVFLAYQFANGKLVPTADQLKAADMNNDGKVTVLDAVMLSSKATK